MYKMKICYIRFFLALFLIAIGSWSVYFATKLNSGLSGAIVISTIFLFATGFSQLMKHLGM